MEMTAFSVIIKTCAQDARPTFSLLRHTPAFKNALYYFTLIKETLNVNSAILTALPAKELRLMTAKHAINLNSITKSLPARLSVLNSALMDNMDKFLQKENVKNVMYFVLNVMVLQVKN